jgi:hypothetical protein
MDKFSFFNRNRPNYPVTDILEGCNALITTKAELAEQLTVSENNIKNLSFNTDGTMTWHSVEDYYINRSESFSNRTTTTERQKNLADVVSRFESYKLIGSQSRLFGDSNIKILKLFNMASIGNGGLRELRKIEVLEIPKLVTFGGASLVNLGTSNGNKTINLDFPLLQNFGDISGNFIISNDYGTNVNFIGIVSSWRKQINLPFDISLISNLPNSSFRYCDNLEGSFTFSNPGVTALQNFSFWGCFKITELIFPHVVSILANSNLFHTANSLDFLSLKKLTYVPNSFYMSPKRGGLANLNIALLDYEGSGERNFLVNRLLQLNWTIEFYDDNDNLVTTL